jgi:riboflavin-specific deaminase-like protein
MSLPGTLPIESRESPSEVSERILRLYPTPVEEVDNPYEDLKLPPEGGSSSRLPYVIINMVTSVDGRVTAEGKASRIGSALDRRVMRVLRSKADAVMIGAGTLRAEKLSLGLDNPAAPQPLAVVVSNTADLPFDENLIRHDRQRFILVTTQRHAVESPLLGGILRVPATPSGEVDLGTALRLLKTEYAVEALLVEGGPRLNHALISQGFADEFFLTLAPKLLGGAPDETLTILHGSALESREAEVLSVHLAGNELFLRYALGRR